MKARLINWYRRNISRHPAAITRRIESQRSREAAERRANKDRQRILETLAALKGLTGKGAGA